MWWMDMWVWVWVWMRGYADKLNWVERRWHEGDAVSQRPFYKDSTLKYDRNELASGPSFLRRLLFCERRTMMVGAASLLTDFFFPFFERGSMR